MECKQQSARDAGSMDLVPNSLMGVGELRSSDAQVLERAEMRFPRQVRFHQAFSEAMCGIEIQGLDRRTNQSCKPQRMQVQFEGSSGGRDHLIRRLHDVDVRPNIASRC